MDSKAAIPLNLAQNISYLRSKRNLTQYGLAQLAGVPRTTLTNIESGSGNPSLQNLVKVSNALQVSIEELLASPRNDCLLIKSAKVPKKERNSGKCKIHKILVDPIPGMEIDRIEIMPGGTLKGVPHLRGTKEYFNCIQGEIDIYVSGDKYHLQNGDVFIFPGDQNHSYVNTGDKKVIGFSVVAIAR